MSDQMNMIDDMQLVQSILDEAALYGLQTESIYWALKAMKENPTLTVVEAMEIGYIEYIK